MDMRARQNPVEALAALVRLSDDSERRASFRQAVTALGLGVGPSVTGAPLLDGLDQDVIVRAAQIALETGLVDDLDWLAPGPAAAALYEITAALPQSRVRLELGRRVFARLYEGTASTFAAVATRMALNTGRPFENATLKARVGLLFDLPIGTSVNADALALSLVTRRELRERWLEQARIEQLPARRLAAKLLEHAAREAVERALLGDSHPAELLSSEPVLTSYRALLADREPLVWRHAAVARGLLAGVDPRQRSEIELGLDPSLSPTEWRRAAVSLVALIASDTDALRACRRLLDGPIAELDKGLPATLVLGLPRVIEAEPELAEELLDWISESPRPDVAEAVAALIGDMTEASFGARAAARLREPLATHAQAGSVLRTIADKALRQLERQEDDDDVGGLVRRALVAYEEQGARPAFELATDAVQALDRALDFMSAHDPNDEQVVPYVLGTLKDVDSAALERPRLNDLLLLGQRPGDTERTAPGMERFYARLGTLLLGAEAARPEEESTVLQIAEQRRLRALLHLMDADSGSQADEGRVRHRISETARLLLLRVARAQSPIVQRIACATLARAFDAAVREGLCEPADVLLVLARSIDDPDTYVTIAEAATNPDLRAVVSAYAAFLSPPEDAGDPAAEAAAGDDDSATRIAERVIGLSRGLGTGGSYRGEALRRVMLRLGRALEAVAQARGQADLVDSSGGGHDMLVDLEGALDDLLRLGRGATRRLLPTKPDDPDEIAVVTDAPTIAALIERSVRAGVVAPADEIKEAVGETVSELPTPISQAVSEVLLRLATLPITAVSAVYAIPLERRRPQLPDWLLPQKTIGAFYVVRALGAGGASSVFMVRRLDQRNHQNAEEFALKVPAYDPTTARSLSEQEFLQLFREEAGALLSLPHHQNLAKFVTFDLGARPRPILVMELIRGTSLDRLIRSRSLTVERTLSYLDGILSGLRSMHEVGVGHLDLKPSNVILRDEETPVLVDFGLSGRHLRPGCGTLEYCSPEVLGVSPEGAPLSPLPADIYSFGCTAFEALTARPLFEGDEMAIANLHVGHDGWPANLTPLSRSPKTRELATFLAACLRHDPRHRPSASHAQKQLRRIAEELKDATWPLSGEDRRRATA